MYAFSRLVSCLSIKESWYVYKHLFITKQALCYITLLRSVERLYSYNYNYNYKHFTSPNLLIQHQP
jgi:hypothetical protein